MSNQQALAEYRIAADRLAELLGDFEHMLKVHVSEIQQDVTNTPDDIDAAKEILEDAEDGIAVSIREMVNAQFVGIEEPTELQNS